MQENTGNVNYFIILCQLFHFSNLQDHLLKMSQQTPKLQDLKEQAAALLTFDLCQQYDPAHNLREECREIEERWEKLKERLQLALQEVKEKVSIVQCLVSVWDHVTSLLECVGII